jgi:hypothetical protein
MQFMIEVGVVARLEKFGTASRICRANSEPSSFTGSNVFLKHHIVAMQIDRDPLLLATPSLNCYAVGVDIVQSE